MRSVRAVGTTTTVFRIDTSTTPHEIDLTSTPNDDGTIAHSILLGVVSDASSSNSQTLATIAKIPGLSRGIFELADDHLRYCIAAPGEPRPDRFAAEKASAQTLVTLKRFYTGEADTIKQLESLGAEVMMDQDGWVTSVAFKNGVTNDDFVLLEKLSRVKSVHASDASITDAGLAHLAKSTSIASLELKGTSITDAGLKHLRPLRLSTLWISNTAITDEGLQHLRGQKQLYNLWLNGTRVTDEGMRSLLGLDALSWVILDDTAVTDTGRSQLKSLPKLERTSTKKSKK